MLHPTYRTNLGANDQSFGINVLNNILHEF
jgi:hypothetical protein